MKMVFSAKKSSECRTFGDFVNLPLTTFFFRLLAKAFTLHQIFQFHFLPHERFFVFSQYKFEVVYIFSARLRVSVSALPKQMAQSKLS